MMVRFLEVNLQTEARVVYCHAYPRAFCLDCIPRNVNVQVDGRVFRRAYESS